MFNSRILIEFKFRLANPGERFAFVFRWVIYYAHLPLPPVKFVFCVNTTFHIVLINILNTLQFILFLFFFSTKVVKKFYESVVGHVISSVDEAFSLLFDVILIVLVLFIQGD